MRHPSQEYNGSSQTGVQYCFHCLCTGECWTATPLLSQNHSDLLLRWINVTVKHKLWVTTQVSYSNRFNNISKDLFFCLTSVRLNHVPFINLIFPHSQTSHFRYALLPCSNTPLFKPEHRDFKLYSVFPVRSIRRGSNV